MIEALRDDLAAAGLEARSLGDRLTVRPSDVASLARAVSILRARRVPFHIRGCGDGPGPSGGTVLDLESLRAIATLDAATGIARVEAGCSVQALEAAAREASATLGPLLPSVSAGSVGAWLAGPTRGERGIPGARRETAALALSVVLAGGRIAESRAAPRSATGPDLDHLALGGEGRLAVIAAAVIRLFPAAPPCTAAFRAPSARDAIDALAGLCRDRLEPARAVIRRPGEGAVLALAWDGPLAGLFHRERAIRSLAGKGWSVAADVSAEKEIEASSVDPAVEVDGLWEPLSQIAGAGTGAIALCGLHAGGAHAAIECGAPEAFAAAVRGAGVRVIAPRSLRDPGPGWDAMGASAVWQRLSVELEVA